MKNIIDPLYDAWLEKIENISQPYIQHNNQENQHNIFFFYLLFDGAQNPALYSSICETSQPYKSLFEKKPGMKETTLKLSPLLVQIDMEQPDEWKNFVVQCSGQPMVNFLISKETLPLLQNRLIKYCTVEQDKQFFNVRYMDTRRLLDFYGLLPNSDRSVWLANIESWCFIGRDGIWQTLHDEQPYVKKQSNFHPFIADQDDFFELNEDRFNLFVGRAEADNILSYIAVEKPHLIENLKFSETFKFIQDGLKIADYHQLGSHVDRQKCCELVLANPNKISFLKSINESCTNILRLSLWVELGREPTQSELFAYSYT